jgi:hypothetical protein
MDQYRTGAMRILLVFLAAFLLSCGSQSADFTALRAGWLRPDGNYVLDLRKIDPAGKIEAAYYNPRPIHVAKAEASEKDGALRVFVELQDVNYPGSTYDLSYDPKSDQLRGTYFQAQQKQAFDVFFVRLKK